MQPRITGSHEDIVHARGAFLLSVLVLTGVVVSEMWASWTPIGAPWIYGIDDAYIHLAMARQLTENGVWGVNASFASCSSSPLWTLLLSAVVALAGNHVWIPFVLNWIMCYILLWYVSRILRQYNVSRFWAYTTLLLVVMVTPLTTIIFGGMEHGLHIVLVLMFMNHFTSLLAGKPVGSAPYVWLPLLMCLQVMVRYESLFILMIAALLLVWQRRWKLAILISASALLPVVIMGVISLSHGWFFFPNSVLLKGNSDPQWDWKVILRFLWVMGHLSLLDVTLWVFMGGLLTYATRPTIAAVDQRPFYWNLAFLGTLILHLQFARFGWLFRYEAYLIVWALVAAVLSVRWIKKLWTYRAGGGVVGCWRVGFAFFLLAVLVTSAQRSLAAHTKLPNYVRNIYHQQWHSAQFLQKYFPEASVAANDIGTITYFTNIRCLDLFGLASIEVALAIRENRYDSSAIAHLAQRHDVELAIVHDTLLEKWSGAPAQWIRCGRWRIQNNLMCYDDTVTVYAVDTSRTHHIRQCVVEFSKSLPSDVIVLPD